MPVFEVDLSYEDMKKAVDSFVCAVCGNDLTVAWYGPRGCFMLRCGEEVLHEGIVPRGRDPELDEIRNKLKGVPLPMKTQELTKLNQDQMLTRIDKARFPQDLTAPDKALMATISIEYGLDPLFGELMVYQGKPYVTIDARRRKAQETNKLAGINSRPATKEERAARGVEEGGYLFICQVWVKDTAHPFEGWGKVRAAEVKGSEHLPIVKDPAGMAEKRAEAQALRRAFHIPLPSAEDIIDAEFVEVSTTKNPPKAKGKPATCPPDQDPATTRKPEYIKTFNELCRACHEDFGMQPKDVFAELGVNSQVEIQETPEECYRRIAAVR